MKNLVIKALQITIATGAILTSGFFATPTPVSAAGACGVSHYFDYNVNSCLPCPVGPYGVSICPDTGIIFDENGNLQTANLILLSAFFGSGALIFLGSKYNLAKLK